MKTTFLNTISIFVKVSDMIFIWLQDLVVGVVLCKHANEDNDETEKDTNVDIADMIIPEKLLKLERFFDDLKGNFGSFDMFEEVNNFSKMYFL